MEKEGLLQGDNCPLLVDKDNQIIVAGGVTKNAADNGTLGLMVEKGTQTAKAFSEAVLADSGYEDGNAPAEAEEL